MSPHTVDEELEFFKNKPLDFEPGSKWAYSSSNFEVLGAVIEKITGKRYGDLLQERIFGPLEMKNTGLDAGLFWLSVLKAIDREPRDCFRYGLSL